MAALGQEFDYRPELKKLKTALLTWVVMSEKGLGIEGNYINNESKVLVNVSIPSSAEDEIKNLIMESKIYICKEEYNEKKIGLDKIWDAFERLKTIEGTDKKDSINKIISYITNDDEELKSMIDTEFRKLTKIGNSYSIRHSEMNQKKLPNNEFIEYLYFRMLSLISCVLNLMNIS